MNCQIYSKKSISAKNLKELNNFHKPSYYQQFIQRMKTYLTIDQQVSPWQIQAQEDPQDCSQLDKNEFKGNKVLKKIREKRRILTIKNEKFSQHCVLAYESENLKKQVEKVNRKCQSEMQIKNWKKLDNPQIKLKTEHIEQNSKYKYPKTQRKETNSEKIDVGCLNELLQKCKAKRHIGDQIFMKRQIFTVKSIEKMRNNKNLLLPKIQLCTIQR